MASPDHVLRAISEDGSFRVIACVTTETVRAVAEAQNAQKAFAQRLGDLVTGALLVRQTMAPDLRVQVLLSDGRRTRLMADALPDEGKTRGLMQIPKGSTAAVLDTMHQLVVMRTMHNGAMQQGHVQLGANQTVAQAIMEYFRVSEQVASFVAIGTRLEGDEIKASAGYVVQLLPEVTEAPLKEMVERLDRFPPIGEMLTSAAADPKNVLASLLEGMPFTQLAHDEVKFGCNCSAERILTGLASLPTHDLADLVAPNEILEMSCDYCGREYKVAPDLLRGMLSNN
ncbi:MAG: Hsp33 family molecular chaperone HslO [Polyangiales bacterium]